MTALRDTFCMCRPLTALSCLAFAFAPLVGRCFPLPSALGKALTHAAQVAPAQAQSAPLGTGGGPGAFLLGRSVATGYVNYFQILTSPKDYVSIRTDYLGDFQGFRTGFPTAYFSETVAYVRYLTPLIMFRPELRYETAINKGINPYDNGTRHQQWTLAADLVIRF